MNLTFRQLRLFLALADTGSVSAAARALHVTQPTASMQLKEITQSIGMPVYEVVGKRVFLTEAGRELAETARTIAGEWEALRQKFDAMRGLTRGRLRVALVNTAQYFMPRLLGGFCQQHPEIDISLQVLNRDGVVARLRDNLDDLYIMSMPPPDIELEDDVFMPNPLLLVAAAAHPLAKKRKLPLQKLGAERFILRESGSGTRMAAEQLFAGQSFRPSLRMELGSNEAIRQAVAAGLGVAVLSRHALEIGRSKDEVVALDVQGFPLHSQWHVVSPKGKRLSPIASVFRDHLLRGRRQRA
ncbi:MAG: LysR family transcriptional regulator [Betaproteobacteria bacterium]